MRTKPFEKDDWHGFSGAEKSDDGYEPRISYQTTVDDIDYVVVVEKATIQFLPNADTDVPYPTYMKHIDFHLGLVLINALIENISRELLIDVLGFIQLGDL